MKTKSILLIDLNMFFGGGQVYLLQLADLLKEHATLYAFCVNPALAERLKDKGVHATCFPWALNKSKLLHLFLSAQTCVWYRLVYGVTVVWANGIPDIATMPVARLLGCTAFATRHLTLEIESMGWYRTLKRRAAEALYVAFARFANKIVCVSQAVGDEMTSIVSADNLVVIHNWVTSMPESAHDYRPNHESLKLLYVGRLQKYKGAATILAAMRHLDGKAEVGRLSLTIVGEGRYRDELELDAEGLDVHFAGFQKDPTDYYLSSDIFINPSIGPEGLPLVSLEAMSHGLACILSDLPVHKEITRDGKAALLFHAGDVEDLSSKLEDLSLSAQLLKHYGELARMQIQAGHATSSAQAKYLRLISQAT